jgi:hypothetical protein
MEEKTLKLTDYLKLTLDFEENPSVENQTAIDDFLGKIIVKDYLPIKDKTIALVKILNGIDVESDAPGAALYLEINKVVKGLLSYCVNLENDSGILANTMGVYDNIQLYGLAKIVKKVCEDDYKVLCNMVDNSINFANILKLLESVAFANNVEYNKWIETLEELKEKLTPEILQGLIEINHANSDEFRDLAESLSSSSLEKVNQTLKEDKLKREQIAKDFKKDTEEK